MRIDRKRNRWRVHYDGAGADAAFYLDYLFGKEVRRWLSANTQSRWAFCPNDQGQSGHFSFGSEDDAILFTAKYAGHQSAENRGW